MNGTSKNVGLGKFWQDLEISKAFLISLEASFLHGLIFTFFESQNFLPRSLALAFLNSASIGLYHSPALPDAGFHVTQVSLIITQVKKKRSPFNKLSQDIEIS